MKKKIFGIMVFVILVMGGFATIAGETAKKSNISKPEIERSGESHAVEVSTQFKETYIVESKEYAIVTTEGAKSYMQEGYPMLPYTTKVMTFPFGTKIDGIEVKTGEVIKKQLDKKIMPAPKPVPVEMEDAKVEVKEGEIYESNEAYPSEWVTYNIGAGIQNGEHVVFLSIHAFPCRYIPASNELLSVDEIEIKVTYTPPEKPLMQNDAYDLVIIAPSEFSDALQDLVTHKENHGMKTKLVTTDEIYGGTYFTAQGRDDAEKIKYFIKNAIEEWGIEYVLLVGGLTSMISGNEWYVPVRYVHNDEAGEPYYISDLYYADIYDANGNFSSWDTNGNGIFGEWTFRAKDIIDGYPDVYVGRLACRNTQEVTTMVEKIITYESGCDPSWFKKVVLAAGDTFNDIDSNNYLEGEIATQKTADYLEGFEPVKIWWSLGNLKQSNVVSAISDGCGFVHFSGHGSPGMWMAKDFTQDPHGKYILGLDVYHMPMLSNDGKYPVVVIGGCHNSMFNATFVDSFIGCIKSFSGDLTWYWMPIPECFGWWIVKVNGGGAIGSIGCTGLGYGTIGDSDNDGIPDCIQYLLGWLETRFFELYGQENVDVLGDMWGGAITGYANLFPPMEDKIDLKTIEEWVLLGDPSLKIGGYL